MTRTPFGPEIKTIPKIIGQKMADSDRDRCSTAALPVARKTAEGWPGPGGLGDVTRSDSESYGEPQARRAVRLES